MYVWVFGIDAIPTRSWWHVSWQVELHKAISSELGIKILKYMKMKKSLQNENKDKSKLNWTQAIAAVY